MRALGQLSRLAQRLPWLQVYVTVTRSKADIASGVLRGGHHKGGLRTLALHPQGIPKVIPLGAEEVSGAIDRFQERQQIRLLSGVQRSCDGRAPRQGVQPEDILQGLGLAAVQVRRVIVDAEQRRHVEPIHPKRLAGGGVVADIQRISVIERPHILEIFEGEVVAGKREELIRRRGCHRRRWREPGDAGSKVAPFWATAAGLSRWKIWLFVHLVPPWQEAQLVSKTAAPADTVAGLRVD